LRPRRVVHLRPVEHRAADDAADPTIIGRAAAAATHARLTLVLGGQFLLLRCRCRSSPALARSLMRRCRNERNSQAIDSAGSNNRGSPEWSGGETVKLTNSALRAARSRETGLPIYVSGGRPVSFSNADARHPRGVPTAGALIDIEAKTTGENGRSRHGT
jgi:hypothetical protein